MHLNLESKQILGVVFFLSFWMVLEHLVDLITCTIVIPSICLNKLLVFG